PALADDADRWRLRRQHGLDVRIVLDSAVGAARTRERRQARLLEADRAHRRKIIGVFRIRAWPTTLDEIDPKLVETLRHLNLVSDRKANSLALRSIAKCRVQDFDCFHDERPLCSSQ